MTRCVCVSFEQQQQRASLSQLAYLAVRIHTYLLAETSQTILLATRLPTFPYVPSILLMTQEPASSLFCDKDIAETTRELSASQQHNLISYDISAGSCPLLPKALPTHPAPSQAMALVHTRSDSGQSALQWTRR
jgi:hypothetical protein